VPQQDADELIACLRQHLATEFGNLGSSNVVSLTVSRVLAFSTAVMVFLGKAQVAGCWGGAGRCSAHCDLPTSQVHSVGDWWEADPESRLFKMAERALRREWGITPLYVREGGTMPVASLIEKMLGAPALMIPMVSRAPGMQQLPGRAQLLFTACSGCIVPVPLSQLRQALLRSPVPRLHLTCDCCRRARPATLATWRTSACGEST